MRQTPPLLFLPAIHIFESFASPWSVVGGWWFVRVHHELPTTNQGYPISLPPGGGVASSGGRSRGGRPARRSASRSTNSICALRLRRSSFAQRCTASSTAASMRRRKDLRSATIHGLLVDRAGVDDGLRA